MVRIFLGVCINVRAAGGTEVTVKRRRGIIGRKVIGALRDCEVRTVHESECREQSALTFAAHGAVAVVRVEGRGANLEAHSTAQATALKRVFR